MKNPFKLKEVLVLEIVDVLKVTDHHVIVANGAKEEIIPLKYVKNPTLLSKEREAVLTDYVKLTFFGLKRVKELSIVKPLSIPEAKIDQIINDVKKEDPWKF